ncbi:hypothetical protein ScalyP_jg8124 [Parmales sp. scaly parma]|nr:hypothetical protein ScalyP_jg8124 [Parmales sp. scaly parma]
MAALTHIVPLLFALFTQTASGYPTKLPCGTQILTTSPMMTSTQIADDTHGFMLTSSIDGEITCGETYSEGATLTVRLALAPGKQVMLEAFSGGLFTSGDDLYNCERKRSTTNDGTATIAPTAGIGNTLTLRGGWTERHGQVHIPTECLLTSVDPSTTSVSDFPTLKTLLDSDLQGNQGMMAAGGTLTLAATTYQCSTGDGASSCHNYQVLIPSPSTNIIIYNYSILTLQ